jgi:integrase
MTASDEARPAKGKVRRLPLDLWPAADREAWNAACRPSTRLKRGGAAGHLKPVTRHDLTRRYGLFLDFLARHALLRPGGSAAAHVTVDKVNAYVAELKDRVSSVTVYAAISRLRRLTQLINPAGDFRWLVDIERDLALVMQSRSKFNRIVLTEVLVQAGLDLMHKAENSKTSTERARACRFRNGLMLALLAFCPIRAKNFVALEIGRSFVQIQRRYWIVLAASETKENRRDERPVDEALTPFIGRYLDHHRPVLARRKGPTSALWLASTNGGPMSYVRVYRVIKMITRATVGIEMSPHMFRTAAVSTAATRCGDNPHLGSALLHHTHPTVTNTHYNRATSITAAENLRQIMRRYDKNDSGST